MSPLAVRAAVAIAIALAPSLACAAEIKFSNQIFTVPDGFEVELVAGPPLVERPVSAGFDDQGRLYVTDSSGSNDKPDKQISNPTHRVLRLEDTDGDGRFDKSIVFADKVMFPQGCLWYDRSVYVAGPPSIWKFTDTDDDGIADQREEWFKGVTLTGCANDIHGPYLGPDGYLYWTKGAFAEQTHTLGNGRKLNDRAAHIYRARPDGSDLDVVMSGGMDNPVEVAFTAEGEAIFTSTFIDFSQPGFRDGIAHAVYGGVFGKQNDVLEDGRVKRTGPDLLHPFYEAGNAAECALCRYESDVFGADYRDNFFATAFNLHKVTRHILRPSGATYASTDSDFLVSDNTDFHPTDVLEDPDGSLVVVDTGGWYKLCCPSSQLAKPDVLGAIYRIRRKGAPKVDDPSGLKINWAKSGPFEQAKLLDDHRPYVVKRAVHQLAQRKNESILALTETMKHSHSADARRNAVWALTQMDGPKARQAVYAAFPAAGRSAPQPDDSLLQTAIHSIGLWRDKDAVNAPFADSFYALVGLSDATGSPNPSVQRAAVEALGRIGVKEPATRFLLRMPEGRSPDPVLEHALIYALVEIGDYAATAKGLDSDNPRTKRAALVALDQMDGSDLKASDVLPFLSASDQRLRAAANWVVGHHPDWGGALGGFFRERLTIKNLPDAERDALEHQLAQLARNPAIQELLGEISADNASPNEIRLVALHAMAQASLKETPGPWTNALPRALAEAEDTIVQAAIAVVRVLPAAKTNAFDFSSHLLHVGRDASRASDLRLDALAALRAGLASVEPDLFAFLRVGLDSAKPPMTRSAAATVIGRAKLSEDQLIELTDAVKMVGPLEVSNLLGAFDHTTNEAVGLKLVVALKESKGFSGLRADQLKPRLEKFPARVQEQGKELLAKLNVDAEKQKAHLEELLASLPKGDIRRSQAIFNSLKTACSTCHAIGYLGGHVGPDLTSIGQARTERDLLESIVYPSASFVRSYEPIIVVTKSGDEYSGVVRRDAPDEVLLATGPNTEMRIARPDIAEVRPGTVSVMPAGLDEQFSRQELSDLVAFLKGTK